MTIKLTMELHPIHIQICSGGAGNPIQTIRFAVIGAPDQEIELHDTHPGYKDILGEVLKDMDMCPSMPEGYFDREGKFWARVK